MKAFILKLRTLVFGAVTGGVQDAKPEITDELADLRSASRAAMFAGVHDAIRELHELLNDEPPTPEANGKPHRKAANGRLAASR
jgi:hypothetical protein